MNGSRFISLLQDHSSIEEETKEKPEQMARTTLSTGKVIYPQPFTLNIP